jgi:transposase, IS30 family
MGTQYHHLSYDERVKIEVYANHGASLAAIGRLLDRHRSTVMRELRRGLMEFGRYVAHFGERYYQVRRRYAGSLRRKLDSDLSSPSWRSVRQGLKLGWSPEQIAGRLRSADPPPGPWIANPLSISHETIYRAIYGLPPSIERRDLVKQLRQSQGGRCKKPRGSQRFVGLLDTTPITERSVLANERRQTGHWEGDLIEGARGTPTVIVTLVERVSRLVRLVKLPNAASLTMLHGVQDGLGGLPPEMLRSLTYDRGTEMAMHKELAQSLGIKVYFCEAYSPWQRGTNENTNGLLRQYLPKGMDFSTVRPKRLQRIEWLINNRPFKMFGWRSRQEEFDRLLAKAKRS